MTKFVESRPFANPEAAARKLLEIVLSEDSDAGQYTNIGWDLTSIEAPTPAF